MRKVVLACLAAGVISIAGCGGDDDAETGSEASGTPAPNRPIEERVGDLNRILAADDCEGAAEITFSVLREKGEADAPVSKKECEFLKTEESFLQVLADVEFEKSAEYGTAAIAEAEPSAGEDVEAIDSIWALDTDGEWRYVTVGNGDAQIDSSPAEGGDADARAAEFLRSVRSGKCDPKTLHPEGTLALGDTEAGCEAIDEGEFLAPALKADRDAEPVPLGATLDWAFYGIPTKDAYFTLLMNSTSETGPGKPNEFAVYDVLPAG